MGRLGAASQRRWDWAGEGNREAFLQWVREMRGSSLSLPYLPPSTILPLSGFPVSKAEQTVYLNAEAELWSPEPQGPEERFPQETPAQARPNSEGPVLAWQPSTPW